MPDDFAGNTLGTAKEFAIGTIPQSFNDFVGAADLFDHYKFTLTGSSRVSLAVTGLAADADLELLNSVGTVLYSSTNADLSPEAINVALGAGTYYVKVFPYDGAETNYKLTASNAPVTNILASEFEVGTLSSNAVTYKNSVGANDTSDLYRLNLAGLTNNLNVSLTGLSADANIRVIRDLNANGLVDVGEVTAFSIAAGTVAESINLSGLAAGTYWVQVYQSLGNTNYALRLSSSQPSNLLFAERDLTTLTATPVTRFGSINNNNTSDLYRFVLGGTTNRFNAVLNGLAADADLRLIRDSNGNGIVDVGEVISISAVGGTVPEAINVSGLTAGTYYLQVRQFTGSTNYGLRLSSHQYNNILYVENDLGTLTTTPLSRFNSVSNSDTSDLFRVYLGGTTNHLNAVLTGLTADADLRLIRDTNGNGFVDVGEVIANSTKASSLPESLNLSGLAAGFYYVQVFQYSGATSYNLRLSTSSPSNILFAENDLGTLGAIPLNRTGSVSSLNTSDLYRFSLAGTTNNFNATLTGLSADADIRLIRDTNGNGLVDVGELLAYPALGGSQSETINLTGLAAGTYWLQVRQFSGATNYTLTASRPNFFVANAADASGDSSANVVFQGGALQVNYNVGSFANLSSVRLEAWRAGNLVSTLGSWVTSSLTNGLVNLNNFPGLTGGDYQLRFVARNTSLQDFTAPFQTLKVLSWGAVSGITRGNELANTLVYGGALGSGHVVVGRGGTDTLNLGVARSAIANINGMALANYNPLNSTNRQAIFRGTALDYITLTDGREIYFQGIENLRFSDNTTLDLQVRTNDTHYGKQWNLRVSDVDSAWRFTRGASNVLLVSLDTGILTAVGGPGGITDISLARLITDPTDDDNYKDYGHGHSAISVMSSTANNASGVAGINWNSQVMVHDVYNGVNLQQAISASIAYARANNMKVVFQGGIQGEGWLNNGGTQAQLESLISSNADIAIFAIAAGNGGPGGNLSDPNYLNSVSGVAKLQTTYGNVMSVGALQNNGVSAVNSLDNATGVSLAAYSNRGSNLTLVAATNSPAMDKLGNMRYFGGTSCANPNMAAITSLVWSVNSTLNATQIRQILIDTAMDLGTAGRDNTYGHGLVNADAAVRRAVALARNSALANLYGGRSLFA